MTTVRFASHLAIACVCAIGLGVGVSAQRGRSSQPETLAFRFIGPRDGNRIASIAGVPGDPSIYYAGAASGGVWKTTDGGLRWQPVSDSMPVTAIGALAVAPSEPNVVWAGTGEAWAVRDSDVIGDGIYKSTDSGKTWTHMGLAETGRIGRIIVHPADPQIVFVCAAGRITGPQQEKGVYRTTDGGAHWDRVLFADEKTSCSGLSIDAKNPRTLIAGMWQVEMHPWAELGGGPSSAVYISHDAGTTWTKVDGSGMPKSPVGKIDVAIAPSDSNRMYALIQTADQGSLWRSDNGGDSWRVVNWDRGLIGRAGYYIRVAVSPENEDEVLVSNSAFWHSVDGGATFQSVNWGGDNHDIWIDPKNADRFVITHDAGASITTQHGRSIQHVALPIGQMYHVATDNEVPYRVYTNMQDSGTMSGIATSPEGGGGYNVPANNWDHGIGGCESGFTVPDTADPNIVWATCYGNKVTRYDARTKTARSVAPSMITLDSPPNDSQYRCHWTAPLAIDPFDHNTVYYGCNVIFSTTNAGQSWKVISPDLSTQDRSKIISSGGIVADNLGQFAPEVVFAIAPSELQKGLVWAGTNDGKVWYTKDGGAKWHDVTKAIGGLPVWGAVTKIEPSHFEAGTAYVAVDAHLMDVRDPFIFKTTDFGATWKRVNGDLPAKHPLSYVKAVAENPNKKGQLFAGTGHGFFYSQDDGAHWTELATGLPHAPVTWVSVQKQFHDVVVSTYGRGLYVLDDITPLEQTTAQTTAAAVHLFRPRPMYRWTKAGRALLNFSLETPPRGAVQVDITDASGKVIRQLHPPAAAGLNRVAWDMRYDAPRLAALRTTPPENPHIWEEPRFRGKDTRPVTHWGLDQAQVGPIVAPGKYLVKLTVDGQTQTQPLEIVRDPKVAATDADLEASVALQLRIRDDLNATSDMINTIEILRKQLEDMESAAKGDRAKADLEKAAAQMNAKMQEVEYKLLERSSATSDDKYFVQAYKVYMNLIWLNGEVGPGAGDVAGGADFRPTDTSVGVVQTVEKDLNAAKIDYQNLMSTDVPAFNRSIAGRGLAITAGP
ncbi:MAG TPA: hypothetical protein VG222_02935 [Vicinamibacterales bacterium]|nr:hypothetical protein [Vicinamibacterales bacterium]